MTSHVVKHQIHERAAQLRATRQDLKQGVLRAVFACHLQEAAACSTRDIKRQASLIQVVAFRGAVKELRVENAWVCFSCSCSGAVTAATSVEIGLTSGYFTMPQMALPVFARSVRHSTRAVRVLLGLSQGANLASAVANLQTHVGGHIVQDVAVHIDNRSRQPGAVCLAPRTLRFHVNPKHSRFIEFMGVLYRHGTRQYRFCSNLLDLACPMVRPKSDAYPYAYLKTDAWVTQRRSLMAQSASISWRPGTEHNYAAMDNAIDLSAGSRAVM